jgi:hypothetical protein
VSKRLRGRPFQRGLSGNPGGRPKRADTIEEHKFIADLKAAAREMTPEALSTLRTVMNDPKAPPAACVGAATAVLDRDGADAVDRRSSRPHVRANDHHGD